MSMRWYTCHYAPRPEHGSWRNGADVAEVGSFSSYIYAHSERHANVLAKRRNIGEVVDGIWMSSRKRYHPYPLTSELIAKRRLTPSQKLDVIHSATFLCYLLAQSLGLHPCDTLGDRGLLHEVIHSLSFGTPSRTEMAGALRYFERKVPGYLWRE